MKVKATVRAAHGGDRHRGGKSGRGAVRSARVGRVERVMLESDHGAGRGR